jgi:hypothetical protein
MALALWKKIAPSRTPRPKNATSTGRGMIIHEPAESDSPFRRVCHILRTHPAFL